MLRSLVGSEMCIRDRIETMDVLEVVTQERDLLKHMVHDPQDQDQDQAQPPQARGQGPGPGQAEGQSHAAAQDWAPVEPQQPQHSFGSRQAHQLNRTHFSVHDPCATPDPLDLAFEEHYAHLQSLPGSEQPTSATMTAPLAEASHWEQRRRISVEEVQVKIGSTVCRMWLPTGKRNAKEEERERHISDIVQERNAIAEREREQQRLWADAVQKEETMRVQAAEINKKDRELETVAAELVCISAELSAATISSRHANGVDQALS
eukprot:TRINITY_DN59885_c0_g1_i2.p1 TRINITY_DN59885_c0_g1~~TRINITY_DN59885_c0_g1_i2.p1  ORF type:complete len:263 (-),score=65.19 TRINITY_DN59885_c0_g1_i2:422-1210(-)